MTANKILYIAGSEHSGSTILGNLLGQIDGFFCGGELRNIWQRLVPGTPPCGCGVPVPECPVWGPILDRAVGPSPDPARLAALAREAMRVRSLPLVVGRELFGLRPAAPPAQYAEALQGLYSAIVAETRCRMIVDPSKNVSYAELLLRMPQIDLFVVQLVRDPRGVVFSFLRRQDRRGGASGVTRRGPVRDSTVWTLLNAATELLWARRSSRHLLLRYEDFVDEPAAALHRILDFVGEQAAELPLIGDHEAWLGPIHTVSGNRVRFEQGSVVLRRDDEWRGAMRSGHRLAATAPALPLLRRYGYPLRNGRSFG